MNFLKSKFTNFIDFIKNVLFFYKNVRFSCADLLVLLSYFWKSPYRIARQEAQRQNIPSLEPYGETPLTTMAVIAQAAGITQADCVYELGCGRGRSAIWLACFIGCKVVGIDAIERFIQTAQWVVGLLCIPNITFRFEDFRKSTFPGATVLYLFGSQLQDDEILSLVAAIRRERRALKIITISFSLVEYMKADEFVSVKECEVQFPWGMTSCYIHEYANKCKRIV